MTTQPDAGAGVHTTRTLVVLLHDRHGAVERVLGAVRRQGCVLLNLALESAGQSGLAHLDLTITGGHPARLAQQLTRLVDVVEVQDTTAPTAAVTSTPDANLAVNSFHSQADGTSPSEGDAASPDNLEED